MDAGQVKRVIANGPDIATVPDDGSPVILDVEAIPPGNQLLPGSLLLAKRHVVEPHLPPAVPDVKAKLRMAVKPQVRQRETVGVVNRAGGPGQMAAANGGEQEFVSWLDLPHPLDKIGTDNQPVALVAQPPGFP